MKRQLTLTRDPIDETALVAGRSPSTAAGAVVTFSGIVRGTEEGCRIAALNYEAFESMARRQFDLIFDQVQARWPVESVRLVHRIGTVAAGEPSLWVELTAPHRQEAFAACEFLIDEMKRLVPIWKKPILPQPARNQ